MDGNGSVTDTEPGGRVFRRRKAMLVDDSGAASSDLATVWRELASGAWKVEDSFTHGERSYLLLREASEAENVAVPAAKLAALDGVISGGGLKLAVHTLGRTQSTVAVHIKQALAFVGLRRALSRTPATLIQAVTAAQGLYVVARSARFQHGGEHLQVVSTLRPEAPIAPLLTSCERDVVSRFLDGESYAEIARGRQRSVRTVANQLSAVFRRVGVSGRLEFVSHLTLLVACRAELKSSA